MSQHDRITCRSCGREGHSRRSHSNCAMNPAFSTSSDATVENPIVCHLCGREGHSRRSHRNCAMNPAANTSANTNTTAVPIVCQFCGREGHSRRTHTDCAMNSTLLGDNRARNPDLPEVPRNNIGEMNIQCSSCKAHMWMSERKIKSSMSSPKFQTCCAAGQAILMPLNPLPETIVNLIKRNDRLSKEFLNNIRTYNSALSFTSMNADLDHRYANNQHGAYSFRIHGSVHHLMSSTLTPNEANHIHQPKFAQIYIFDSENELQNRVNVAGNRDINQSTLASLQQMMHSVNPFVELFKTMEELSNEQQGGIVDIRMIFRAESSPDPRRYNSPTANEIGVLIVGGDDESDIDPRNRDIVLRLKGAEGNELTRINELHQHYDPLQYVLMFPFGDPGWNINIKRYNPDRMQLDEPNTDQDDRDKAEISVMQYYSSRLMLRPADNGIIKSEQVSLHSFGKLFHQYAVDMYAKMEQQRLNFIRYNQKALRAEVYNGLRDSIQLSDSDMSSIGKRVILPSTFIGGPRFMAQLYQDAMNLVRRFGKPDLFITFTCNPAWPEITRELLKDQKASDRPDLCARVFNLKLRVLLDDIVKKSVLGKVVAYVYSIEFQKRGLPHCHMLFILADDDKPRTPEDIDRIVSAEIPNPIANPLAHETVTTSMVHGPCGLLNPQAPCMKNGKCSKNYPFEFAETTILDETDKLIYRRRRMHDRTILRHNGATTVDNRWIVPYNPFLAAKFNAHINVEICTHVNSVKYIYKYVFKGHDRAQIYMGGNIQDQQDEIKSFLDARYVSAAEACWRLFSFPMHKEYPASQRLDVHLPGETRVYFDENDHPQQVIDRDIPESTLTAWFKYNLNNPNDEEARATLYTNFCERYTYHIDEKPRFWSPRRGGFGGTIGRMYTVSPRDVEKYHFRTLLLHIPGAASFQDMRTFDGQIYPSYQATARAMGLLADDTEWSAAMTEAALTQSPNSLRQLFCILLAFSGVSDPFQLWLNHKTSMAEDYLYRYQQDPQNISLPQLSEITDNMFGHCLLDLNDILADHRYDLKTMEGFQDIFPATDTRANRNTNHSNTYERMHSLLYDQSLETDDPDQLPFNESQALVYNTVRESAFAEDYATSSRIFFIDGPGGTGKTFVFNALLDCVRRSGNIAIAVASSGTAALLLKGGRTAHSTFKIPLEVTATTICDMTPRSSIASFIQRSKLIVWDECSMVSKDLIETVDRSFRDILKSNLPFGGCLMVFGGDFRQVLPIIPKASRSVIVGQCLNRASFWPQVRSMQLHTNMRVQQALQSNDINLAAELQQFAEFLLNVGQGRVPTITLPNNVPSDFIQVPNSMLLPADNLLHLIRTIYFNIADSRNDPDYFVGKAILTAKNKDVKTINNLLLEYLPGRPFTYNSSDQACTDENQIQLPVETLNTIENGSLPPHALQLKIGSPIMVIRNIDPAAGICNGTRLIVNSLGTNVIEATIATGPNRGGIALIPKIKFISLASDGLSPFDFQRIQFPVRLAFAMTINKAQGQTLESVGLYLPCHVFGHGQLYVALSRVRTPASLKIMIPPEIAQIEDHVGSYTQNIVFKEVFQQPNH